MKTEKLKPGMRRLLTALIVVMTLLFAYNAVHTYVAMEGLAFWGYPYISSFVPDADKGLTLRKNQCPLFIATGEFKLVGVSLTNTTDQVLTSYVQTVFTSPQSEYGVQYETETITLQGGETQQAAWEINESNIVNGKFILARSFVSSQPAYVSNRSVPCHSIVLNFYGLPSNVVGFGILGMLVMITTLMAVLFIIPDPYTKMHGRPRSSLIYLLAALAIMTFASLIGSWLLGFLMIIFILLGFLAFLQVGFT